MPVIDLYLELLWLILQQHSLISKLCLLTLHFPRLRIIWSRSLHATADIFRALKVNQDEPEPVTAAAVGTHTPPWASLLPHAITVVLPACCMHLLLCHGCYVRTPSDT